MRVPEAIRWPAACLGGFLGAVSVFFVFAGLSGTEVVDCTLAVLAGTRPQTVSFSDAESIHPVWLMACYAAGLMLRIYLIASWAAYLMRRAAEKNELRLLRRLLQSQMNEECAEPPAVARGYQWN